MKECSYCEGTGQTDKTTNAGEWIKVPCTCVKPMSDEDWQKEADEIREAMAMWKNCKPAWMNV